jgi:hypothetical protein
VFVALVIFLFIVSAPCTNKKETKKMALPFYCCPTPYQKKGGKKKPHSHPFPSLYSQKMKNKFLKYYKLQNFNFDNFSISHPNVNPPPPLLSSPLPSPPFLKPSPSQNFQNLMFSMLPRHVCES